jgi:hypothetical protein
MGLRLGTPPIEFNFWRQQDGPRSHPKVEIEPERGVIIGGGARVFKEDGSSPDNLLTALFPQVDSPGSRQTWVASSKDHAFTSPALLEAWCVTADLDPRDVYVARAANASDTGFVDISSYLPKEYELVAGGARTFFQEPAVTVQYPGALLLTSSPVISSSTRDSLGWSASATDHLTQSPVAVESYAIGINRDVLSSHKLKVVFDSEQGAVANHPTAERMLDRWIGPGRANGIVVGGGVEQREGFQGGNFLTSSWPIEDWSDPAGWRGTSEDHNVPDPVSLVVTAFAIIEDGE